MDYENAVVIAQSAALIFFLCLFALIVAYVFWPSNKDKFERAARQPLEPGEGTAENRKY